MDTGGRVVWHFDAEMDDFYRSVDNANRAVETAAAGFKQAEKAGRDAFGGLAGTAQDLGKAFGDLGAGIGLIGGQLGSAGAAIGDIVGQIGGDLADLGTFLGSVIVDAAGAAGEALSDFAAGLLDTIANTEIVKTAIETISEAFQSFRGIVGQVMSAVQSYLAPIVAVAQNIAARVQAVFDSFKSAVENVVTQITTEVNAIKSRISEMVTTATNRLSAMANAFVQPIVQSRAFQTAMGVASKAGDLFSAGLGKLQTAAGVVGGRLAALGAPLQRFAAALGPIPYLAGQVGSALAKIGWNIAQGGAQVVTAALKGLGNAAVAAAGNLAHLASQTAKMAFNGATAAATGLGAAIVGLGAKGLGTASELQSLQIAMNGLTHSTTEGNKAIAAAYEYAQKSPFQTLDVAAATKTLIAFGQTVDEATGNLETLGNISITTGVPIQSMASIFGEVSAQGKLTNGVITQLTQNGVSILPQLQKQFGKTADEIRSMAEAGQISFAEFREAMGNMVDPSILEQLNNTMPRQLDRLGGSIRQIAFALVGVSVDAQNGFKMMSDGLAQASTTLVKTLADTLRSPELKAAAATLGNALVPLVEGLTKIIPPIVAGIAAITQKFAELGPYALPILGLMVGGFSTLAAGIPVIGPLLGGITAPLGIIIGLIATLLAVSPELQAAFGGAFQSIGEVLKSLAPTFQEIGKLLMTLFTEVGKAAAPLITALADAFGQILTAIMPILPILIQIFIDIIQNVVMPIIPILVQIIQILAQVFTAVFTAITPLLPLISQLFVTIFQQVILPILPLIVQLIQMLADVFMQVMTALMPLLPPIIELATTLITSLAPILPLLINLFLDLIQALLPLLPPLIDLAVAILPPLIEVFKFLAELLIGVVVIAITIVIEIFRAIIQIIGKVVEWVAQLINWFVGLVNKGKETFSALWEAIKQAFDKVIEFVRDIPKKIMEFFSNAKNFLKDAGKNIIDGLIGGIKDSFNNVKNLLGDLTKKIAEWKGPAAVDKKLLIPNAKLIMGGFLNGLESQYGMVQESLGNFTNSLGSNIDIGVNTPRGFDDTLGNLSAGDVIGSSPNYITNEIGQITIANEVDAEDWLKKLTREDEVTRTGLTQNV